ncbi:MAG: helix-turn-helix domain-containing protein [bacterium]
MEPKISDLKKRDIIYETVEKIIATKIEFKDIQKKTRDREYIYARGIAYTLCKQLTNLSLKKISFNKDHATVLHGLKAFQDTYKYQTDPFNVLDTYNWCLKLLKSQFKADSEKLADDVLRNENLMKEIRFQEQQLRIEHLNNINRVLRMEIIRVRKEVLKDLNPIAELSLEVPKEHVENVLFKMQTIIKCLPQKNLTI